MENYCKLNFHGFKSGELTTFTNDVINGIYSNPGIFTNPPLTAEEIETAKDNFSTSYAEFLQYGKTKKSTFINARKNLMGLLDKTADYINLISEGDPSKILLAGFTIKRDRFKRVPSLDKIPHFKAKGTGVPGEVMISIPAIINRGSINYSCLCVKGAPLQNTSFINGQIAVEEGGPQILYDCNKSRMKKFQTLKSGVQYYFYVFASNTANVSPLSDSRSLWVS